MKPVHSFNVIPSLPPQLERLRGLAYNLRWAWNHETIELFRRLDRELWESCWHNPVIMLGKIDQQVLQDAANDDAFLAHLDRVAQNLDEYLNNGPNWFRRCYGKTEAPMVAYFSAEFGLTECVSIFAGGLGVLAGDHLKSASDLGVPLVAVGLLYQQGYFKQYLNADGWQQERYDDNDFLNLPLVEVKDAEGAPLKISVELPGRRVWARVWRVAVGRIALYLLDANIGDNAREEDRNITDQLYGGDNDMRIRQEILLGIGGYRALEALGIEPSVYHMNEGHSAFLSLERVRRLMETQRLNFEEARLLASSGLVFTTHTPVEAGHDYFPPDMMARYFGEYAGKLGLSMHDFLGLGRKDPANHGENFCMTVLALRLAAFSNGVSKLHGAVSREMWQAIWPGLPKEEAPIGHVTNGVHFRSWISAEMNQLYDRYLGPQWRQEPADQTLWKRVESIPSEELWRTHERRRERLVAFARRRLREQLRARGAPPVEVDAAEEVLDPEALTIGFARRFATYKRATLLLRDRERLARILNTPGRPVQVIFAGKAHPRDDAGKALIREIIHLARQPQFRTRIVFLEDYDMAVSRYLVQGCDVWLNTPLRPLEASGTSGMKALANGVLNLSTLDGWWDEAWAAPAINPEPVGWAIGQGESYTDRGYQDQVEVEALYDLLERDVVPTFYDRRADGVPRRWVMRMKSSIGSLCHLFNTHRMVQEYSERFYLVANANFRNLTVNQCARTRSLSSWLGRVREAWPQVHVEMIPAAVGREIRVGERISASARVRLGPLTPEDVCVELMMGRLDADGGLSDPLAHEMQPVRQLGDGVWLYEVVSLACCHSGRHGYTARVLPSHPGMPIAYPPGLISWAAD